MSLAEIELAVRTDDHRRAIALALALWRGRRHPDLADLVALISARWVMPPLAARSTTSVDFHDIWLRALERDPIGNLAGALATLTRALPFGRTKHHVRYAPWFERVAALATIADPRIADAFLAVLERMPFLEEVEERLYEPVLAHLARLGDVRQRAPLRALLERPTHPRAWLRDLVTRGVPPVVAALDAVNVPAIAGADALERTLTLLGGRPPRARTTANDDEVRSLLELVLAALDDDGPREVLADFWLERGDPRGHLIALQLKEARGTATAGDLRKAERLVKRHEEEWVGTLVLVSRQRIFRRGFLEELTLTRPSARPETWARVHDEPALATVRVIHRGNASEPLHARLVAAAPNLRAPR